MTKIHVELPPKAVECLTQPARYKVLYGGRGGAKSWSIAGMLICLAMTEKVVILCTREFQTSIRDSVHRLLSRRIDELGLGRYFDVQKGTIICTKTGSEFIFAGLADKTVDSIKSLEGAKYCWVEEAQTVSDRSWQLLIPTIRAEKSEIWISFNPDEETDPTYQRFIKNPPPNAIVCRLNWDDNPWLPDVLKEEKDNLYASDPEAAAHVWGGQCRRYADAQILRGRYRVQSFAPDPATWDGPYHGVDFGFAHDPGVMIRCWIWEGDLYVEYEAWGVGVETDLLPSLWDSIPNARAYVARADSSRPETISQVQRLGFKRVQACQKWPGSVQDGVEYLRSFQNIIIHPRCVQTAIEARLWSFKRDRLTGDVKPEVEDKNNHCWDAIRYALEPLIMGYAKKLPAPKPEPENGYRDHFPTRGRGGSWMAG